MKRLLALALLVPLLPGCASIGADGVRQQRLAYNLAVQTTNDQELLLNLVRLRYRDTLYFLNVERVASTLELNRSLGLNATLPEGAARTLAPSSSLGLNDKPTIFYTPLEGERFARQLMKPLDTDLLLLLANSGWSLERVFALCLLEVNGLRNAPSASGPTPALAPEYREFREAVHALRELQRAGLVTLGLLPGSEQRLLELRLAPGADAMPATATLRRLLRLDPALNRYTIVPGFGESDGRSIRFAPRSLLAVLSYLSQGVEAPASHQASGLVTLTLTADGQPFDWQQLLGGLMRIESSKRAPDNAAVAVAYRGHWYFLRDDDLDSKSTFALISQIFSLQAGSAAVQGANVGFSINK